MTDGRTVKCKISHNPYRDRRTKIVLLIFAKLPLLLLSRVIWLGIVGYGHLIPGNLLRTLNLRLSH